MKKQHGLIVFNILLGGLLLAACAGLGNPLDGTNWQLDMYRDQSGDLVSVKKDTLATAQFQATKVSGIAACNNYSGSYEVDGKQLTFGPLATTRKFCADPPGIMKQEEAYLAALSEVQTFKQRDNSLEMFDAKGRTLLGFSPAGK